MAIPTGRRCLVEAQLLPAAAALLYTAPAGTSNTLNKFRVSVDECHISPPSGATTTATLYVLPSGVVVPAAQHVVLNAKSLASTDQPYMTPEIIGTILEPGDSIWGLSAAGTLGVRICGELYPA